MKVVALAGGVGGARLADGLYRRLLPGTLTVIVNTGDDFRHFGLQICPDLDTVCYTLAGMANPQTGWGRTGETWQVMESVARLGGPTWFRLGDRDLGTHLERTRLLASGRSLSEVTRQFCQAWGIMATVLPMSDQPVATKVMTDRGELDFQHYFVELQCQPAVRGFRFAGVERARPAPGVLQALEAADLVVICPSNPWVSIDPILAVPGLSTGLGGRPVIAVSPIVGGRAIKGPAAKMYRELGIEPSPVAVAGHYHPWLAGLVLDQVDAGLAAEIEALGVSVLVTDTIMKNAAGRERLARETLAFAERILQT